MTISPTSWKNQSKSFSRSSGIARLVPRKQVDARRRGFASAGLALILSIVAMFLTGFSAPANAQCPYVLTHSNSTMTIQACSLGAVDWVVDGVDHLNQRSFWYRLGVDQERPVSSLTITDIFAAPRLLDVTYEGPAGGPATFRIEVQSLLTGGEMDSCFSDLATTVRVFNISGGPISLSFFDFTNLDLMATSGGDTVTQTNSNLFSQSEAGRITGEESFIPTPTHWQAGFAPAILALLNDTGANTLNDAAGPFTGDAGWALEWDLTLGPGASYLISEDHQIAPYQAFTQEIVEIIEPGGAVFNHVITIPLGPPAPCNSTSLAKHSLGCNPQGPFHDAWVSNPSGSMCHHFGVAGSPSIPADFFGPNSDPFSGMVCLMGQPIGANPYGDFGDADTIIERSADPFDRCAAPSAAQETVDIEIVALSLVSTASMNVTYSGGQGPTEQWDVAVDLSPVGLPPGTPPSTLTAVKTHCGGGTYTNELYVQPRFTFTKLGDPMQVRLLDTGAEGIPPVRLEPAGSYEWVHDVTIGTVYPGSACSEFHAGISESAPIVDCDCNANGVRDDCDFDCQPNGTPDDCDIQSGASLDLNANSYPDECEFGCTPLDCNGHGQCLSGTCNCDIGYVGAACDQCATDHYNYPTCVFCLAAATCSGHGACNGQGTCDCDGGWSGAACIVPPPIPTLSQWAGVVMVLLLGVAGTVVFWLRGCVRRRGGGEGVRGSSMSGQRPPCRPPR